jgi:hypothetical protein
MPAGAGDPVPAKAGFFQGHLPTRRGSWGHRKTPAPRDYENRICNRDTAHFGDFHAGTRRGGRQPNQERGA